MKDKKPVPTVDFDELENTILMLGGPYSDTEAWVCLDTGKIHVRSDLIDEDDEPLPDDIDTSERYIALPDSRDLDLGHDLAFRFAEAEMPQEYERVREIFRKKGAFGRFSHLVESRGLRDKWHQFRDEQTEAALREWCEKNGLALARRPPSQGPAATT
jgi:hypothetical protein